MSRFRAIAPAVLLASCGVLSWALMGNDRISPGWRWIVVVACAGVATFPPVRVALGALVEKLKKPSPRAVDWTTLLVALLSTTYLVFTALHQDRDLFPKTHDEGSYLLGIRMLASGHLWMPQHELADFFDTFYVLVRPVYASLYFPGTALLYAPGLLVGWPTWAMPALAAGLVVGLLYRITTELSGGDGSLGLLAALLLTSVSEFRMLSILLFSHLPLLLLGLLMTSAWLRWQRSRHWGWATAIGLFAGWAAITRPVDALAYALPVGAAAMLLSLRGRPARAWGAAVGAVVVGAVPFLALQIIFNVGLTGRVFETPYTSYLRREQPNTGYGFHPDDPAAKPASVVPQKRDYYDTFMRPFIRRHTPSQLPATWAHVYATMVVDSTLPSRALLPFAFVGTLALWPDRRRVVVAAVLPMLVLLYLPNPFFLEHYAVPAAPAMILLAVLGLRHLIATLPAGKWRRAIGPALCAAVVALAVTALPEANLKVDDEPFHSATLRMLHTVLPESVHAPAVVLFTYTRGDPIIEEPVTNNDTPWPDDAPIIRAHDLGPRNIEIFRYYAQHQPDRAFYRFDRRTKTLEPLGSASEAAAKAK